MHSVDTRITFELQSIFGVYSKPINFLHFYGCILHSILFL